MVVISPPPKEVAQYSSFPIQGNRFTQRQQEIIGQLQALAGNPPRVLTSRDIAKASKEGKCSSVVNIQKHFGRFADALRAANLPIGRTVGQKQWNADDTPKQLRALALKKNGQILTCDDIKEANRQGKCPSKDTLARQSGSFNNALRAANLPVKRHSRQKAIRQLRALAKNLKRVPTVDDVRQASRQRLCPSLNTLRRLFGSFNNALRSAQFPARKQALAQYLSLKNNLDRRPSRAEVNAAAEIGICPTYETLCRLGVPKQVREERNRLRGDTCADCEKKKPFAMFLGASSQWVCQKCYRKRTGGSQPKRGICTRCNKGPRLISYRQPVTGENICKTCYENVTKATHCALRA